MVVVMMLCCLLVLDGDGIAVMVDVIKCCFCEDGCSDDVVLSVGVDSGDGVVVMDNVI